MNRKPKTNCENEEISEGQYQIAQAITRAVGPSLGWVFNKLTQAINWLITKLERRHDHATD